MRPPDMLIAVEGCVGAGKSTVVRLLAKERSSMPLLEQFEANPFLEAFYENPATYATETEFSFLLHHYHQLKTTAAAITAHEVVSDFHLGKDLIYADLNLTSAGERRVFQELFHELDSQVARPDLMVCLSASDELIVERIRRRDRSFEQKVDTQYFARLNAAYEAFFATYTGLKLNISMDDWDFVTSPALAGKLSALLDEQLLRV